MPVQSLGVTPKADRDRGGDGDSAVGAGATVYPAVAQELAATERVV